MSVFGHGSNKILQKNKFEPDDFIQVNIEYFLNICRLEYTLRSQVDILISYIRGAQHTARGPDPARVIISSGPRKHALRLLHFVMYTISS